MGRLTSEHRELPNGLGRIADFVLTSPAQAASATITQLAEFSGTSAATVNRFCHRFGFEAYSDLKVAIATDFGRTERTLWNQTIGSTVQPGDSIDRIAAVVAAGDMQAIQDTVDQLDHAGIERVVSAISSARRIHLFGVGGSYISANELRHRLHMIGLAAWSWSDVHDGLTTASTLSEDDMFITFSHSGTTTEAIDVQKEASSGGAFTTAITNSPHAPLSKNASVVLVTTVNEGAALRSQALAARHSQLFLIDLIFVAVANRAYDQSMSAFDKATRAVAIHAVPQRSRSK